MIQKLKEQNHIKISNRFAVLENLDVSVGRTWTEWIGVVVTFLTRIWEMAVSNLGWIPTVLTEALHDFLSPSSQMLEEYLDKAMTASQQTLSEASVTCPNI